MKPFLWVAFPKMLGGYRKIIELAQSLGFGGIAPRAGQRGWNDRACSPDDVKAIVDAGLDCLPWIFSEPDSVDVEVEDWRRLEDAGATAGIIDAEIPWDRASDAKAKATRYGELSSKRVKMPLYDAPWPMIDFHPGYPEREFRWVAGRMIQTYATEIGWTTAKTFDTAAMQWAKHEPLSRVLPIGITYGRSELQAWGAGQLPPRDLVDADLVEAASRVRAGWYSGEAARPATLQRISALLRAQAAPTREPGLQLGDDGPAVPLGWADRAESARAATLVALRDDERAEMLAHYTRNLPKAA